MSSTLLLLNYFFSGDLVKKKAHEKESSREERKDLWSNVDRYKGEKAWNDLKVDVKIGYIGQQESDKLKNGFVAPTETLKEVIKHRPPVADVVREITKESEKDKMRQKERERMQKEAEKEFKTRNKSSESDDSEEDEVQRCNEDSLRFWPLILNS